MTKRRRDPVEDSDYVAFTGRIMKALATRGGADPETLVGIAAVARQADAVLARAMVGCHDAGYSYAEIADRLGIKRQSVHERIARQRALDGATFDAALADMNAARNAIPPQ